MPFLGILFSVLKPIDLANEANVVFINSNPVILF